MIIPTRRASAVAGYRGVGRWVGMHIGLIGGIGPKATSFYYESIARAFAAASTPLRLTIAHTELSLLAKNLMSDNKQAQAKEFERVTLQLQAAGAERVAITSFGGAFVGDEFAQISPLPIVDGPTALVEHLRQTGLTRVGILGTTAVMGSKLYGKLYDVCDVLSPGDDSDAAMQQCHDDYRELAFNGVATPEQRSRLFGAAQRLVDRGAQRVVLGGTDLNVIFDGSQPVPVLDSAKIHVNAIVAEALRR